MAAFYSLGVVLVIALLIFWKSYRNRYCRSCKKAYANQYVGKRYVSPFSFANIRVRKCMYCNRRKIVGIQRHSIKNIKKQSAPVE